MVLCFSVAETFFLFVYSQFIWSDSAVPVERISEMKPYQVCKLKFLKEIDSFC